MLGIQHLRGQRREPEEAGVELVDPVKKRARRTYAGSASVLSLTPASRSSCSDRVTIDSLPRRRLLQNAETSLAPGNRPAMPTTAIAFSGTLTGLILPVLQV